MTSKSVLGKIANWSAQVSADELEPAVVTGSTRSVVDTLGVGLAGANRPLMRAITETIAAEMAHGPCKVLGSPLLLRPTGAALINAAACHVLDFDDTCYDGIVHASSVILPAVLACGEEADAGGADLLAGFVVGSEVTYVLGRTLPDVFWKGWWTTSLLGAIGAAAGCARALALDVEKTTHAMALASCFTFGLRTVLGTDATALGAGYAAEAGVRAALLGRAGVKGPEATFESELGLARMFNAGAVDHEALETLGSPFALGGQNLSFKAYPACSGVQAAAEGAGELLRKHALAPQDVRSVIVTVTPLVAENLRYPLPQNLTQAQFSMPFAIGCQLRFGEFGINQLSDGILSDPALQTQMQKVKMICSDGLVSFEDRTKFPEAASVTIELLDGTTFSCFVAAALGSSSAPMSDEAIDRKFLLCAERELGRVQARMTLEQLRSLRTVKSTRDLVMEAA